MRGRKKTYGVEGSPNDENFSDRWSGYIGSTLVPLLLSSGNRVPVLDAVVHAGRYLLGVWLSLIPIEFLRVEAKDVNIDLVRKDEDLRDYRVTLVRKIEQPTGCEIIPTVEAGLEVVPRGTTPSRASTSEHRN